MVTNNIIFNFYVKLYSNNVKNIYADSIYNTRYDT